MSELAIIEPSQSIDVGKWAETLVFAAQLAEKVHDTEFVPAALRGRPEAVAATIMYGAEVGITPMQALAGIHIVDGRPAPSAELMRAMILRAGHSFQIHEMSGTRVRVSGLRRGAPDAERVLVEWTLDMARAAGLLGKRNWQNYPRSMLMARATGDLARILFADVVKGLGYVAEAESVTELSSWGGAAPEVVDAPPTPPKKRLQRRRAAQTVPVDDAPAPDDPQTPDVDSALPVAPPVIRGEDRSRDTEDTGEEEARADGERPSGPAPGGYVDVPLPEMEPEPSAPEPPPDPRVVPRIGPGPLKALHTGLTRELGTAATREEKHALVVAIVGHPISSTKELTRSDGYRCLDYMDRFASGAASWQMDGTTGEITVHDEREEPPEDTP